MANRLKMAMVDAILRLLQRGWSYRRIGRELGIHRDTVARLAGKSKPAKAPLGAARKVTLTARDNQVEKHLPAQEGPFSRDGRADGGRLARNRRERFGALRDGGWEDRSAERRTATRDGPVLQPASSLFSNISVRHAVGLIA